MIRRYQRILSFVLVLTLTMASLVWGAEITEDGHVIQDPERLEEFEFPNNWSRKALEFCVGNHIMSGREDGLAGNAKTTRAETGALLVLFLGAKSEDPDLSRFRDAVPKAWYYDELAAAVEMGIMSGVSDTALAPNSAITREQVFTMLSRAFGLYPKDENYYKVFDDSASCAKYARNGISALAEQGNLAGYNDGTVGPKRSITRAELAQLLYALCTCVCDDPEQLPDSGKILYRGSEPVPAGYAVEGNLVIGGGYHGEQVLTDVRVSDTLVLRPALDCSVRLEGCNVNALSVPASMEVSSDTQVSWLVVSGGDSVIDVPAEECSVFADAELKADLGTVLCNADGITVELDGNVEKCVINGKNVTVIGDGHAEEIVVNAPGADIQIENGQVSEDELLTQTWEDVETLVVWDTVTEDTYLYENSDLTGRIQELPAGTRLEHYYYHEGRDSASVYTEDGRFGYADIDCIQIPEETEIQTEPYTQQVMEDFVNEMGYSSSTGWLIWTSLKTQTVNVFRGSKGSWELEKSMPCASGKNATPTVRGEFTIQSHAWEWNFGTYKVRNVSIFYEGYAFHSRIWSTDYGKMLDDSIGYPVSDGCLRMLDEDCLYIMEKVPTGTRVVVY